MDRKNKPKILIATGIFPPEIGGPASYAKTLADRLTKQDIEVVIVTYAKQVKTDDSYPYKIIRVWSRWPIWIKHALFGLRLLSHVKQCDIVYALNIWSAGVPAYLVAKFYKKKFIVKIVGDYAWEVGVNRGKVNLLIDDFQSAPKRGWIGWLWEFQSTICRKADKIITPSKYLADLIRGWGVSPDRITVIYNGVDFEPSTLTKEKARQEIGIHGNIITSIGRLTHWKGFRMLIKIMPALLETNQFFRLVIIGDGPDLKFLNAMVKNMGLDRKVYLVGRKKQAEISRYLAASDIFVLNSGYEGFSHQILEVLQAGVPIIASAVGGNKEIINPKENGFLVKYNDEFNLIEAIKGLWQLPELQSQFIKQGKKTALLFSADRMVKETVDCLIAENITIN